MTKTTKVTHLPHHHHHHHRIMRMNMRQGNPRRNNHPIPPPFWIDCDSTLICHHPKQRRRLLLPPPQSTTIIPRVSNATPSDSSKFLLRVDDVCVMVSQDPAVEPEEETTNSCCGSQDNNPSLLFQALYIDLGREFSEQSITLDALQQLRNKALEVTATNSDAHIMCIPSSSSSFLQNTTTTTTTTNTTTTTTTNANIRIHWKPEGSTHKHMKQLAKLDDSSSTEECYQKLKHHVLIWSGSYHNKAQSSIFLWIPISLVSRTRRRSKESQRIFESLVGQFQNPRIQPILSRSYRCSRDSRQYYSKQ